MSDAGHTQSELDRAYAECRRIAGAHYENFPVASLLVPRRLRRHFHALYAYCRISDDLGDEGPPATRLERLLEWEGTVRRAFAGGETGPAAGRILPAALHTARLFQIPEQLFFDLLTAFKRDQETKEYADERALLDYCVYSANPVGRMVLHLASAADPDSLRLSDLVCTGLQLANFCQDVRVDLAKGRVYIPLADMTAHAYPPADLRARIENEPFASLMRVQVERARRHLLGGLPLGGRLGGRIGLEIRLIVQGGLRILEKVEQNAYRVLSQRPILSRSDFLRVLLRGLVRFGPGASERTIAQVGAPR